MRRAIRLKIIIQVLRREVKVIKALLRLDGSVFFAFPARRGFIDRVRDDRGLGGGTHLTVASIDPSTHRQDPASISRPERQTFQSSENKLRPEAHVAGHSLRHPVPNPQE